MVAAKGVRGQLDYSLELLHGFIVTAMRGQESSQPLVPGPLLGTKRNGAREGPLGVIQSLEPFIRQCQGAIRFVRPGTDSPGPSEMWRRLCVVSGDLEH